MILGTPPCGIEHLLSNTTSRDLMEFKWNLNIGTYDYVKCFNKHLNLPSRSFLDVEFCNYNLFRFLKISQIGYKFFNFFFYI